MTDKIMEMTKGKSDILDTMAESMQNIKLTTEQLKIIDKNPDKSLLNDGDIFPCGLMMCGSGFGFSVVSIFFKAQWVGFMF